MQMNLDHFVPVFTIEDWEDFDKLFRGCGTVVFRGQGNCAWNLTQKSHLGVQEGNCGVWYAPCPGVGVAGFRYAVT